MVNVQVGPSGIGNYAFPMAFFAPLLGTSVVVRAREERTLEAEKRAYRLSLDQEVAAAQAVAEERQRIARELHDVIAHSVSVMTVQAGAVRRLLLPEQERERQALETVEATGREALTEMRRLVGLLREHGTMPEFAPQPSLRTLDVLIGTVREAGLPVDLEIVGDERELPPGVDLSAYRLVQEALTNTLKYAGPGASLGHAPVARHGARAGGRERRPVGRVDNGAGARPRRHARARRAAAAARSRPARATAAASSCVSPASGGICDEREVLIVDDQALVRAGFRMMLDAEPEIEVVGEAADGARGGARWPGDSTRRDPDGRADAERGRSRGDPALLGRPDEGPRSWS